MISRKSNKLEKHRETGIGSLLIAKPFWKDIKYDRSVILLLNHDLHGSTGILINKQSTLQLSDALPLIKEDKPLFYGGPCDTHTISYIHNMPDLPEAVYIAKNTYWGGNYDYLQQLITDGLVSWEKIKFFAGFVEWGAGQLECEIEEDKWWSTEMKSNEIFTNSVEHLWSFELLTSGHSYGLMADIPDPSFN